MMKFLTALLAFAVMLIGAATSLRADDNWLQNGSFTDGITHWRGNGRSPADFASDNPLDASDPLTSKGLIIPLRHTSWSSVAQDFRGKSRSGVMTITFMKSPDFALSTKDEDYQNVPGKVNYTGWSPFRVPPGTWVVFVTDPSSAHGTYYHITPKAGPGTTQTIRLPVAGLTPYEEKTVLLAIPPGEGKLVFLNISLTGGQRSDSAGPLENN